jgi:hypothetical protein
LRGEGAVTLAPDARAREWALTKKSKPSSFAKNGQFSLQNRKNLGGVMKKAHPRWVRFFLAFYL